eukprot:PhM_4_TR2696/c0_g1_i1/m.3141/K07512/MECR, NRBF1; mitochondrial trans-2-enoyl-CoA reductase
MVTKRMVAAQGYRYHTYGNPRSVMKLEKYRIPFDRAGNQCVVRMLAAPVHAHDRNMVEGTFGPIRAGSFPAIGGTEGLGIVEEVGAQCQLGMGEGDMVWINNPTVGTWTTHVVTEEANLDVMPNRADLDIEMLANMSIYHTAHHLLNDFVQLSPGDVVLQTGASAPVSQVVQALARARGAKVFSSMQLGRSDHDQLVARGKHIGAYAIVPYSYIRGNYMRRLLSDLPAPKLLLNHVGGLYASSLAKLMGDGGVVVSYGSAVSKPMQMANLDIIQKQLQFRGFFLPTWNATHTRDARMRIHQNMVESLVQAQGHSYIRAMRFKFDTDAVFAFHQAWDAPLASRKPVLRMVGEYGEWRRPRPEVMAYAIGRGVWEDIMQETWEGAACTETPASFKYQTPFKDWVKDFHREEEAKEVGHRDIFLRRTHMPRHNTPNSATTTSSS